MLSSLMQQEVIDYYIKGMTVDQILDKMDLHEDHRIDVEYTIGAFIAYEETQREVNLKYED